MVSLFSILAAILLLGALIFVHELGHYSAARLLKIRVVEFALGFGPRIVSKKRNGITYSLRALPLGGFCSFLGEDEDRDDPDAYNRQPAWRRLLTQAAGPVFNLVAGFLLAVFILTVTGEPVSAPIVGSLQAGGPAAMSGLQAGDHITSVNGTPTPSVQNIVDAITANGPQTLTLGITRGDQALSFRMTPFYDDAENRVRVGLTFGTQKLRFGLMPAIPIAARYCWNIDREVLLALRNVFFRGNIEGLSGPVGTINVISQSVRFGLDSVLHLCVLLSLNLGLFNLLPLPALDGGRMIFTLVEMVRGKPVDRNREGLVHLVGLIALMLLMVVFTYRDIVGLFKGVG